MSAPLFSGTVVVGGNIDRPGLAPNKVSDGGVWELTEREKLDIRKIVISYFANSNAFFIARFQLAQYYPQSLAPEALSSDAMIDLWLGGGEFPTNLNRTVQIDIPPGLLWLPPDERVFLIVSDWYAAANVSLMWRLGVYMGGEE